VDTVDVLPPEPEPDPDPEPIDTATPTTTSTPMSTPSAPTMIPAIAKPRPPVPSRRHCRRPTMPKITPSTLPIPTVNTHTGGSAHTNEAMQNPLVAFGWGYGGIHP
jgi:hypothetical protein